jgi:hypothetical protein
MIQTDHEPKGHSSPARARAGDGEAPKSAPAGSGKSIQLFISLVRKLERNWPLSVALMLLSFIVLHILKSE